MNYLGRITQLVESDSMRMEALHIVHTLALHDWLIAAGFVRDMVWANIYGNAVALNDIDVIYYCREDISASRDISLEKQLQRLKPGLSWSVKNQARMHLKNGDNPYRDSTDAMGYWPEKQTAIGVRLSAKGSVLVKSAFDLELLFNNEINRNPARSMEIFNNRLAAKHWLKTWPMLKART